MQVPTLLACPAALQNKGVLLLMRIYNTLLFIVARTFSEQSIVCTQLSQDLYCDKQQSAQSSNNVGCLTIAVKLTACIFHCIGVVPGG